MIGRISLAKLTVAPCTAGSVATGASVAAAVSVGTVVSVESGGWVAAFVAGATDSVGEEAGVFVSWLPQAVNNPTIKTKIPIFTYIDFIFMDS
jgi:hypothetical protein